MSPRTLTAAELASLKPSQIELNMVPPLVDTLGKARFEHAAALLVRVCQVLGDRWQPVSPEQLARVVGDDVDAKLEPWRSLNMNPFFRPDFPGLVSAGFATWSGEATRTEPRSIALTEKALLTLGRWVRGAA